MLDRYQMRFNASPAYLMDRTGNTIAASNRDTPGSFVGHNFGIRPYFQEAMQGLPGRYFAVSRHEPGGLRLSFAGLDPAEIRKGVAALGQVFRSELDRVAHAGRLDPAPAMV